MFLEVEHNISRIKHLLVMYRMSVKDFLQKISEGLKTPITEQDVFGQDVFGSKIRLSHLKRIDKIFDKGLHYYLDPKAPETSKEASVFFRKQNFQAEKLNLGAIKIVNQFEESKLSLSAIAKLSDMDFKRQIKKYSVNQNPRDVANEIRTLLYPPFDNDRKKFLKSLISKLAYKNILVFEFIETWNKKEKANIDGFCLTPNMIVLKRHPSFSREIFTLAHELGHYLLGEEEIDLLEEVDYKMSNKRTISNMEKWCNDFAFFFLAGDYAKKLDEIKNASSNNDYHHDTIEKIFKKTHLSPLALYTRLFYQGKIYGSDYNSVKNKFKENYIKKEREEEKQLLKEKGIKQGGHVAKPILSPLFISTIQTAYYEGVLNEYEVCKKLNIKPDKLYKYI